MDSKGYICVAQNNIESNVDYIRMAYGLALSLKKTQFKVSKLSIVTDVKSIPEKYQEAFDHIIPIQNDRAEDEDWKLHNIVDLYNYTPYDETVMLDSDMLFLSDVSHWWDKLNEKDIWFTTNTKTYQGTNAPTDTIYRQEFIKNNLPSVYNAFFYFKKSDSAEKLFNMMKLICTNWNECCDKYLSICRPKVFSTDVAFGLAVKLLGLTEQATLPELSFPYFTHMKTQNQGWKFHGFNITEDWTRYTDVSFDRFNESLGIKIGTVRQFGPLHYHVKDFLTDKMLEILEE